MSFASRFKAFIDHPAGPKTIHFWAPGMKWALVIAGLGDINRPAEKISVLQTGGLSLTGIIWSRYSTQIIPVNYNLLSVNVFVALTGLYQFYRAINYQYFTKPATPTPTA